MVPLEILEEESSRLELRFLRLCSWSVVCGPSSVVQRLIASYSEKSWQVRLISSLIYVSKCMFATDH